MSQQMTSADAYRTRTLPETLTEGAVTAPENPPTMKRSGGQRLLWILLLISLVLNGLALFWLGTMQQGLKNARLQLLEMVSAARVELQEVSARPIELQIAIDQEIPISNTVTISDTFSVPVNTVLPFSTQVNTAINIPLLGRQDITLPVSGSVPISVTFEIPLQADFPISMTHRLILDLPVSVTLPTELLQPIDQVLQRVEDGVR